MSKKADYTAEEWELLLSAPFVVPLAVVAASPSGPIGLVKEGAAVASKLGELARQGSSGNELIDALVSETRERRSLPRMPSSDADSIKASAVGSARKVAELLQAKSPTEAEQVKHWLYDLANRTAEASREGGFLGFGGVQVSDAEKAVLGEIAGALGVRV
jgi:hypothetical protein